jgi:hypothetical protein
LLPIPEMRRLQDFLEMIYIFSWKASKKNIHIGREGEPARYKKIRSRSLVLLEPSVAELPCVMWDQIINDAWFFKDARTIEVKDACAQKRKYSQLY